jgi:hypothetical protein
MFVNGGDARASVRACGYLSVRAGSSQSRRGQPTSEQAMSADALRLPSHGSNYSGLCRRAGLCITRSSRLSRGGRTSR